MLFFGPPEHVARHVDRFLDGLSATDQQRSQVKQIVEAAASDLRSQRDAMRSLHERSLEIFTAPSVDANAAEAVRQQLQAQNDLTSRRILQAMLDVSNVLTPEQRAQLAVRAREMQARMQQRMHRPDGSPARP